ncbi:MAG: hypothetical protein EAZ70_05115 [Runella slithyformis]|jgi:hypothetical protein|nr:MAG: hypothetical protein EAY79_04775 [Runella slithyformis]TAF97928.1 MAG: hypothetical protein EAZ46_00900 [Runella sp.]TAG22937.1 MAG: hypothetical protein EAZ38_04010 [Cytophagales bacterium]TAG41992.1 MAG: hypothetical protein EAZ32_01535 [Cytophagia bacterium]TAE98953.1 MAG: hypothetical protein EAZ80_05720 [Runella slithyformis]
MKKWIFLLVLLLLVGGGLYYVTFGYFSDGTRVGSLVKLSRRGYVFKTFEGQLQVGGMTEGTGSFSSTTWDFSVDDDNEKVVNLLEEAMKTGQRVSLHYEEKFFQLPWNGDTKYFVVSVELIPMPVMAQPMQQALPAPTPAPVTIDTINKP